MKWLAGIAIIGGWYLSATTSVFAEELPAEEPIVYVFGTDTCAACRTEIKYLFDEGLTYEYLDIENDVVAKTFYEAVREKHDIGEVLPVAVVGAAVVIGYKSPQSSGRELQSAVFTARESDIKTIAQHIEQAPKRTIEAAAPCSGLACDTSSAEAIHPVPFLGTVDLPSVSPILLSVLLGVSEGINMAGVGLLLILLGLLFFASERKQLLIITGVFALIEVLGHFYFYNFGYRTIHMFPLAEAFARLLETSSGLVNQQIVIFVQSLFTLLDDALMFALAWYAFPYSQQIDDKQPGLLNIFGVTLLFLGGAIIVHRIYFA